jgi:flagellar hook protein FlgE
LTVRQAIPIQVDRANTGADSPLSIDLFFGQGADNVTSLTDDHSALAAANRDGSPLGTLSGFGIGPDGIIVGAFTNGLTRNLGQVVVATFTNNEGLLDEGGNMFSTGANSGTAQITTAGTLGAGLISGGALEQSNVDLSDEFIKMITASTGYSASSRVIKTTDELFQQLLVLGR